jgi:hypothetical protein
MAREGLDMYCRYVESVLKMSRVVTTNLLRTGLDHRPLRTDAF